MLKTKKRRRKIKDFDDGLRYSLPRGRINLLVHVATWRVPKEKSREQLEVWGEMMDYWRAHPEKSFYTRSRFFTFTEKGSSEENWMFIDEYETREDFEKWMKAAQGDPELLKLMDKFFPKWDALIIQGSKKSDVWTEVEKLRVEPPPRK